MHWHVNVMQVGGGGNSQFMMFCSIFFNQQLELKSLILFLKM